MAMLDKDSNDLGSCQQSYETGLVTDEVMQGCYDAMNLMYGGSVQANHGKQRRSRRKYKSRWPLYLKAYNLEYERRLAADEARLANPDADIRSLQAHGSSAVNADDLESVSSLEARSVSPLTEMDEDAMSCTGSQSPGKRQRIRARYLDDERMFLSELHEKDLRGELKWLDFVDSFNARFAGTEFVNKSGKVVKRPTRSAQALLWLTTDEKVDIERAKWNVRRHWRLLHEKIQILNEAQAKRTRGEAGQLVEAEDVEEMQT